MNTTDKGRKPLFFPLVLGLLICCATTLRAQDTLFYANGKYIVGHVEEVGLDLVRYRTVSGDASVLIVVEKRDLARIKRAGMSSRSPERTKEQSPRLNSWHVDMPSPWMSWRRRSTTSPSVTSK